MSSLVQRVKAFLNTPRGRQLADRGRRELAKPSNQQRLRRILARFSGRR
jgi:sigma54-dependent transcription regulator